MILGERSGVPPAPAEERPAPCQAPLGKQQASFPHLPGMEIACPFLSRMRGNLEGPAGMARLGPTPLAPRDRPAEVNGGICGKDGAPAPALLMSLCGAMQRVHKAHPRQPHPPLCSDLESALVSLPFSDAQFIPPPLAVEPGESICLGLTTVGLPLLHKEEPLPCPQSTNRGSPPPPCQSPTWDGSWQNFHANLKCQKGRDWDAPPLCAPLAACLTQSSFLALTSHTAAAGWM